MNATSVQKIADFAVAAERASFIGKIETVIPAYVHDGSAVSLEHLQAGRSRFRGSYKTNTLAEFIVYTKTRVDSQADGNGPASVFVNAEGGAATAFFNLGNASAPGHADDRASLDLRRTAAFTALLEIAGKQLKQKQLAEFLEDWFDVVEPLGSDNITVTSAIAAIRDITITSKGEQTSVQGDLQASRSALEEIEAKSRRQLPTGFHFITAPYDGFTQRPFNLRLAVLPQDKEPLLTLRIVGLSDVFEKIGQEFESELRNRLTGVNVYRGTFTP